LSSSSCAIDEGTRWSMVSPEPPAPVAVPAVAPEPAG
jgi:hypothetical protein